MTETGAGSGKYNTAFHYFPLWRLSHVLSGGNEVTNSDSAAKSMNHPSKGRGDNHYLDRK
jgi:hypothetical protein